MSPRPAQSGLVAAQRGAIFHRRGPCPHAAPMPHREGRARCRSRAMPRHPIGAASPRKPRSSTLAGSPRGTGTEPPSSCPVGPGEDRQQRAEIFDAARHRSRLGCEGRSSDRARRVLVEDSCRWECGQRSVSTSRCRRSEAASAGFRPSRCRDRTVTCPTRSRPPSPSAATTPVTYRASIRIERPPMRMLIVGHASGPTWGQFVLPSRMAPDEPSAPRRSHRARVCYPRDSTMPSVVGSAAVSMMSFAVNGTPCSGPMRSPRANARSCAAACSRASAATATIAFSSGSSRSIAGEVGVPSPRRR